MAQRKTLTERQVKVLRWIADGCTPVVMTDDAHKITTAALRNRGLVRMAGRGQTWTTKATDAGRDYLAQVDGPNPPLPRQANLSVTAALVADVVDAGGSLRVPRPSGYRHRPGDYRALSYGWGRPTDGTTRDGGVGC